MDKERLEILKERIECFQKGAERIMEGGENYDGADGARNVLSLCSICFELMEELKPMRCGCWRCRGFKEDPYEDNYIDNEQYN